MRNDHRRHSPPAAEEHTEDHAQYRVTEKAAEALVEVVAAANQSTERDSPARTPAELVQPGQQVTEDDNLLENPVLHAIEKQNRIAPPHRLQVLRDDVQVESEMKGGEVQAEPAAANQDREHHAPDAVLCGLARVETDQRRRLT